MAAVLSTVGSLGKSEGVTSFSTAVCSEDPASEGGGLISLGASRKTLIPLGENKTTTTDLEPDLKHALFKNTVLMNTQPDPY